MFFGTWAHGTATVVLDDGGTLVDVDGHPFTSVVGYHAGWGTTFRGRTGIRPAGAWFHIPIPTPTIQNDRSVFLDEFYVLFTSDSGAGVSHVHAWDGNKRIAQFQTVFNEDGTPYQGSDLLMGGNWSTIKEVGPSGTTFRTIRRNFFRPRDPAGARILIEYGVVVNIRVLYTQSSGQICFHAAGAKWSDQDR